MILPRILTDSALQCHFVVEIDGMLDSGFQTVSGLEEGTVYRGVVENNSPVTLEVPETIQLSDIVLRRGIAVSDTLFEWYRECRDWRKGKPDYRKSVSIVQLKWIQTLVPIEIERWTIHRAFVKRYRAPQYDATNADTVAVSELVIGRDIPLDKAQTSDVIQMGVKGMGLLNSLLR